jgi:thiol:disulfide interchange protein DsbD
MWTCCPGSAYAQTDTDPFAASNSKSKDDDPFAAANRITDKPAPPAKKIPTADRIDFEVSVSPQRVQRGETVQLKIRGIPRPGYHTYPLTQRSADLAQDPAGLSTLIYEETSGLKPLWPIAETPPEFVKEEGVGEKGGDAFLLEHKKPFTWSQDLLVLPDTQPGTKMLRFHVKLQVCNESSCVWGEHPFEKTIEVSDELPARLSPALRQRLQAKPPEIKVIASPQAAPSKNAVTETERAKTANSGSSLALIGFLWNGVIWGAVSLLTPCVFPMIPITVSFFLKQSEKAHHPAIVMASVYSLTIVVVLTVGGVLLIPILQPFSQHWVTNLILGALFLFFALSLFGMYEIRLPSSLANYTSAQEGRGGLAGTMFMALTFTIISFTCVAPFYGGFIALSAAAQSVADWVKLTLGALAFSVTFASPFFVLALFPSLLRTLPKSGSWMNTIKVVMGFLEVAAALKFLRAGELYLFAGAKFLTYDLVLGMYIALALMCGLYLLNLYRLPHDDEAAGNLGVPRLLFALLFLSLGLYLMPGLFKTSTGQQQRPAGEVFNWLDSFLLPDASEALAVETPTNGKSERLAWLGNLDKGLKQAEEQKQLVFVDFTGLT